MNAQFSVFVICVEAIKYLLLYNLIHFTFNVNQNKKNDISLHPKTFTWLLLLPLNENPNIFATATLLQAQIETLTFFSTTK